MNSSPAASPAANAVDAALGLGVVAGVWLAPDWLYTAFVTEDGPLEWLQVVTLVAVLAVLARGALQARTRRGAVGLAAAAAVAFVAIGEELAWGSRLFGVAVASVQAANVQHDLTLHNIGGLRGLHYSYLAIAAGGVVGAVAVLRSRPGLALWFLGPAVYAAVRVLDNDPITSRFAKLSEVLELVLYVAVARALLTALERRRPTGPAASDAAPSKRAVAGLPS